MPGPIAISRAVPSESSHSQIGDATGSRRQLVGSQGTPGALGASFGPSSATYREAIARSFGKDATE